jgi:Transposase DDE domain group 1
MILALLYPIVLGLDRLETSSFLRANGTFQYLTGLPSFPDPQTVRRFLLLAPPRFWEQMHRLNDRLLQTFIHQPEHRSRLIFDLDSTVVTVFGQQDGAEVGYNPRYRDKRSYNPLLCIEANSSYLGIPSCVRAMLALGMAASNFWTLALPTYLRTSGRFGFEPMPALASVPSSKLWNPRATICCGCPLNSSLSAPAAGTALRIGES